MPDPCKATGKNVLLVEGKSDCHVVLALQQQAGLQGLFGIYECGSDEEAIRRFNALIVAAVEERPEKLGIILDADDRPTAERWNQVRQKLLNHGYECPNNDVDPNGTIVAGTSVQPKVGIWIMPNNRTAGRLEDFLLEMVNRDAVTYCAAVVENARTAGFTSFAQADSSKAIIHTYLAWQNPPGRPFGTAVTARVLNHESGYAPFLLKWLAQLF